MICEKCGNENNQESMFCNNCGADLSSQVNTADMQINEMDNQQQMPNLSEEDNHSSEGYNDDEYDLSKQKKSKMPIFAGLAVLVAVITLIAVLFYPKLTVTVMGHEAYYLKAEKKFVEEEFAFLMNIFKSINKTELHSETDISFDTKGLENEIPGISELIDKYSINLVTDIDSKTKRMRSDFTILRENKSIIKMRMQEDDKATSFSLPEYSENQIVQPYSQWNNLSMEKNDDDLVEMTGLTAKETQELSKRIMKNIITDSFDKKDIKLGKDKYKEKRYSTTTFVVDKKVLNKMLKGFLSMLEDDELLRTYIKSSYNYVMENNSELIGEMFDDFESDDAFLEDFIENYKEEMMDVKLDDPILYTVFYSGKKEIVARRITVEDNEGEILIGKYKDGSENVFEITVKDEYKTILEFINKENKSGSLVEGNMKLSIEDKSLFKINYSFKPNETIEKIPVFVGEIKITTEQLPGAKILYTSKKEDKRLKTVIELSAEGSYCSILMDTTFSAKADLKDFSIDKETTLKDEELQDIALQLLEKLGGIPELNGLSYLLGNPFNNSYYDDYDYDDYEDNQEFSYEDYETYYENYQEGDPDLYFDGFGWRKDQ
ncbi:MAG TPA: zinc ribbon domain-containing protein [Clostridiales bacterium]|nr:zinc ribbon domain-containing protein [Clostridiales bacterium]